MGIIGDIGMDIGVAVQGGTDSACVNGDVDAVINAEVGTP